MDQISGTTPAEASTQDDSRQSDDGASLEQSAAPPTEPVAGQPGFRARGRMRRRARFLRKARELAYRDLGGLVFNLHRFGQRNDALVMAKLSTLGHIDAELRTLETDLRERQGVTVLREAGITACARCAAIHSSEDRFCPNCGLSLGPHPDLPIAGAAAAPAGVQGSQSAARPAPRAPEPAGAAGPASTPAAARPTAAATATPKTMTAPVPAGDRSAATTSEAPAATSSDEDEPTEIIRPSSGR